MARITINNSTWTQVLDGAGFCISSAETEYAFNDVTPTVADAFTISATEQINGLDGKILWAKAIAYESMELNAELEA